MSLNSHACILKLQSLGRCCQVPLSFTPDTSVRGSPCITEKVGGQPQRNRAAKALFGSRRLNFWRLGVRILKAEVLEGPDGASVRLRPAAGICTYIHVQNPDGQPIPTQTAVAAATTWTPLLLPRLRGRCFPTDLEESDDDVVDRQAPPPGNSSRGKRRRPAHTGKVRFRSSMSLKSSKFWSSCWAALSSFDRPEGGVLTLLLGVPSESD